MTLTEALEWSDQTIIRQFQYRAYPERSISRFSVTVSGTDIHQNVTGHVRLENGVGPDDSVTGETEGGTGQLVTQSLGVNRQGQQVEGVHRIVPRIQVCYLILQSQRQQIIVCSIMYIF